MLDHVTIGVSDLERSMAFYDKALKAIGIESLYSEGAEFFGYGAHKKAFFWIGLNRRPSLVSTWLLRFRIALPSTAFTQRLSVRAGATTASQGFGPTIIRTTAGHLSSIRTATTLRPFAAILRDRAVRN